MKIRIVEMIKNRAEIIFVLLSILVAFTFSVYERYKQLDTWKASQGKYFVKELPSVSTMDAYHWLRFARDKVDGTYKYGSKDLRGFPEMLDYPKDIPVFSKILVYTYKLFSSEGYDPLYMGSIKVSIFLSSLFIIPLIIYIYMAGAGIGGFLGALIGTFGVAYYERTSVGRVDTDGLLMLAPFLFGLLLLVAVKSNRIYLKYILTCIVALLCYIFSGLHFAVQAASVGYFIILAMALILHKTPKKHLLGLILTYFIFSNPIQLYVDFSDMISFFNSAYLLGAKSSALDSISKTLETVAEARKGDFSSVIQSVIKNDFLFYAGVAGSIWLFVSKFRNMIFILPVFIAGLMAFFSLVRFAIFLTPFIGIGLGYILWETLEFVSKKMLFTNNIKYLSAFVIMLVMFLPIKSFTGIGYVPAPSLPVETSKSITELKNKLLGNSIIFSWWDLGYPLEALGSFTTISDGGLENIEHRFSLATGYFSNNSDAFYRFVSYISNEKLGGIRDILIRNDEEKLKAVLSSYEKTIPKDMNIYVLYSEDMLGKLYSISQYAITTVKDGQETYYNEFKCTKFENSIIYCDKFDVDMKNGFLLSKNSPQKIPLYKISLVNNGYEVKKQIYNNMSKYYISVVTKGNDVYKVLLYTHDMANTVFHQQYMEGRAGEKFTEVYNNYPYIRVFRFNP